MQQPLVTRPAYGEHRVAQPVAESKLPEGPPAGKGVSLDPSIPGTSTFAKPTEDIRTPEPKDESIFRVDGPDDLAKDQSSTPMDQRDHTTFKPRIEPGGSDVTPKTKYPYRDGVPNAHNAAARNTMSGNNQPRPHDLAEHLRHLASDAEANPSRSSLIEGLRNAIASMDDAPVVVAADKRYETPAAMAKAMKDLKETHDSLKPVLRAVIELDKVADDADMRDNLKAKAKRVLEIAANRVADAREALEDARGALGSVNEILDVGTRSTFK